MNILIIHEIDWLKKVIYEPHHLAELFSMKGHNVFVIDWCLQEAGIKPEQIDSVAFYDKPILKSDQG